MVSHDLQTPLNVAFGRLDLLRETGEMAQTDEIERALNRIEELTTDMLALVRHDSASSDARPIEVEDIAERAWRHIDTRQATLEADYEGTIKADEGQVRTLFENLFRNAVGHGGATVTVRIGSLSDGFYMEDTGPGIPSDQREAVFEHGYSTGYEGTGVGLTIVKRIAEAHE